MERQFAVGTVVQILFHHREKLRTIASRADMEFNRFFLKRIRDDVDRSCRHFEKDDACEEHEDIYLPLFDALSLLNTGLGCKPIYDAPVKLALEKFDELHDLLHAVPA